VLNAADPAALTVHEITDAILTAMGGDTEVLPFEGTADEVGATPWSVPYDVVADMRAAYDQLGYRPVTDYPAAVADTVRWLCDSVSAAGWRDQLPGLSAYDTDLFDYGAEDRWRQQSRV
jgi:nucleoside-diphosphate-sugar epimerase